MTHNGHRVMVCVYEDFYHEIMNTLDEMSNVIDYSSPTCSWLQITSVPVTAYCCPISLYLVIIACLSFTHYIYLHLLASARIGAGPYVKIGLFAPSYV